MQELHADDDALAQPQASAGPLPWTRSTSGRRPAWRRGVQAGGLRGRPIDTCVPAIARFCDCKVWLERDPTPPSYVFFGFDTDTALASYLFAVIDQAMRSELEGFRVRRPELAGTRLRQASSCFQIGLAARVAERLTAMHVEREASVTAQRPTGVALVLLRRQVVEDAFRMRAPRLRTMSGLSFRRDQAFRGGREAGERVNLRRPVTREEHAQLKG